MLALLLGTVAALIDLKATEDPAQAPEDMLVTDVIRFYDQDCWAKFCDAQLVKCIAEDPNCQGHFAPVPKMVNMMPQAAKPNGMVTTSNPVKEDDAGGGPVYGLQDVLWSQLSAPELKMMECAKENQCVPSEESVREDDALLTAGVAAQKQDPTAEAQPVPKPAIPASFLEVGELSKEDLIKAVESMAEMKMKTDDMKAKMAKLDSAKAAVSNVAQEHAHKVKLLEALQQQGLEQVMGEKTFINNSRARMAAAQAKLRELAQVTNPGPESFAELVKTRTEIDAARAEMLSHMEKFKSDFHLPNMSNLRGSRDL